MGWLARLFGVEKRASARLSDPYLAEVFGLRGGYQGYASPEDAVNQIAVVARAVSLIAEGLASLPLPLYRRTDDGGQVEQATHPLHRLLNDAANDAMTAYELRALLARDILTTGNAFARVEHDARGAVS